tara:strand:+ start:340 stop:612 length:273 start_codon:yes stop_codon:yes gene_type:complete
MFKNKKAEKLENLINKVTNNIQSISKNINSELTILLNAKDRVEKIGLSVNGNSLHIEEQEHLKSRISFLQSQEDNLQHVLKEINLHIQYS